MRQTIDAFFFDTAPLDDLARRHHDEYVAAEPFPHVVFEDLVPVDVLQLVASEFPTPGALPGITKDKPYEKKLAYRDEDRLGPHTRHLLGQLNSATFLRFLQQLTGIDGLIPDPYLHGGGLHQIERGGFLSVHADFNVLGGRGLDRRLNLLLYLNEDWDESWGGHLELWTRDMSACAERIAPTLGTCVIFSTLSDAFHGHPDKLTCPADRTRNSLALYYYSNGRPAEEARKPHSTLWRRRPGEVDWEPAWRRWVPPAALDAARRLRRRRTPRSRR